MITAKKNPVESLVRACMDDSISEEDLKLARKISENPDMMWPGLEEALKYDEKIDYEDLEILLGEDEVTEIVVCPSCGNLVHSSEKKCPACGREINANLDPWSLYNEVSRNEREKELIFVYSDYESGRYLFLERIDSVIYEKYRLIEVQIMEKMATPVVRVYENVERKGGI